MARLAIFIDGAYLDWVQREVFKEHCDLEKLSKELAKGNELYRTYYYNSLPYQSATPTADEAERFGKAQGFFGTIDKIPRFQVQLGKTAYRGINDKGVPIFEQKRVDILLGTDLVLLAAKQHIAEAVLIAGDSDFVPAVEKAKSEGVLVRLYSHHGSIAQELWNLADERCEIDKAFIAKVKR